MSLPGRLRRQRGRHARVDDIPFELPVNSEDSPAIMAAFPISSRRAAELLPGRQLHPFRLWGDTGLLLITVIDYHTTDIGSYIEFSIGIACTRGRRPAPALMPLLFRGSYGLGQFVYDLPVSTEISVKGGKGIWGMPKHRASLDFLIEDEVVSSRYDLDDELAVQIDVDRPERIWMPVRMQATNYCRFRGMLMKSAIHFRARAGVSLRDRDAARLILGDHPRVEPLRRLEIRDKPLFTAFLPDSGGVLDDHVESWFLTSEEPVEENAGEGLESVVDLGLGEEWPPPPDR